MISYPHETHPAPGSAVEVAPDILWLRLPLPMAINHVNVYALRDVDGWTLVDTGVNARRCREAWEAALAGPLAGHPVVRVLVTHHHPDHVGLAGWFQAQGAELLMTRTAWLFARMLTLDVQTVATPEQIAFWQGAGMVPDLLEKRRAERPFNFADIVAPMPLGFTRLEEGQVLRLAGRDWTIRFGHGHAPDHATLWSHDGDIVIGGDQLLPSISPNLGVYATEPMADPVADWITACQRLRPFATERQLILPGHKLPFTGLPDRLRQMIENHEGALDRLRRHLAHGAHTAAECFAPLYKREIDEGTYGLALVEAVAHLNHLLNRGEVTRIRRQDGAWLWSLASDRPHP
ncbi:MBL fold metallo-hydrolase [Roseibacterium sp. SDUM158016]|uniref:MBL fold metallo-hydrolase n=1 Tax=Roseicyclus sediminis TaxID=2980997 RepID=UPI0021D0F103|nr:MBL fold metallo-hydrolase [Roseibacterium sp. SDUM158016]MCU4651346.1 MBL fold metallo-hydrolase [Roseibacterium sp. SDUM158016]